jgi:hypothetical protein
MPAIQIPKELAVGDNISPNTVGSAELRTLFEGFLTFVRSGAQIFGNLWLLFSTLKNSLSNMV